MSISDDLEALQSKVETARRQEAQQQVAREAAESRISAATDALRAEFGVDTVDQAQSLRAEYEEKIAAAIQRITGILESSNG